MIINKTPHPVTILDINLVKVLKNFPVEGEPVRLAVSTQPCPEIDGFRTTKTIFGEPESLPDKKEGVFYIVSQLVKNALPERDDLLVPAEVVRDETGRILGCKSFGR